MAAALATRPAPTAAAADRVAQSDWSRAASLTMVSAGCTPGGYRIDGSSSGTDGRIRMESLDASAQTQFQMTPVGLRVTGPSPVVNPLSPTVRITSINGQLPPAVPQGGYGAIDVVLPAPGVTGVDVATSGVPSGTTVLVTVKPRIGGAALSATVPLNACNTAGECTATTAFNLAAGAYFVEARATFQVQ